MQHTLDQNSVARHRVENPMALNRAFPAELLEAIGSYVGKVGFGTAA
jgi:hypothetical protein